MKWHSKTILIIFTAILLPFRLGSCHTQKQIQHEQIMFDSMRQLTTQALEFTINLNDTIRYIDLKNGDTVAQRIIIRGAKAATRGRDTTKQENQSISAFQEKTDETKETTNFSTPTTHLFDIVLGIFFLLLLAYLIRLVGIK